MALKVPEECACVCDCVSEPVTDIVVYGHLHFA